MFFPETLEAGCLCQERKIIHKNRKGNPGEQYLGGPVAVGVAGVQTVIKGLHEAVKLRPEPRLERL